MLINGARLVAKKKKNIWPISLVVSFAQPYKKRIRPAHYCFTIDWSKLDLCTVMLSGREWLNLVMK